MLQCEIAIDQCYKVITISMNMQCHISTRIYWLLGVTVIHWSFPIQNSLMRNSSIFLSCSISFNNLFIKNPLFPSSWIMALHHYVLMLFFHMNEIGSITCLVSTYLFMTGLDYWTIWYVQLGHPCLSQHIFHIACFTYLDTSQFLLENKLIGNFWNSVYHLSLISFFFTAR